MMRRPLTTLALVATCGLLALGAIVLLSGQSAGSETARARMAGAAMRTSDLSMSAVPGDLALAEISFAGARDARLERSSLQVAVSGAFGDDYLATAVLRPTTKRAPAALVLLVNRPSPLLDPTTVALRISAQRSLGAPDGAQARQPVRTARRRAGAVTLRSAPPRPPGGIVAERARHARPRARRLRRGRRGCAGVRRGVRSHLHEHLQAGGRAFGSSRLASPHAG